MVKFLIIRLSSIGDIVLTTPVIRCLKTQVEDSEIHFLTKIQFSSLLNNNPYIDKLWLFDKNLSKITHQLKEEKFDYIIDLHHNLRTLRIKNRLRVLSFSFNKLNLKKWILVNFKKNLLPPVHIVDRYMDTIKLFDIKNDGKGLDYFLSEEEKRGIPEVESFIPDKYIVFSIGGKHNTKKAPAVKIAAISDKLDLPVVLLGDKTDKSVAAEVIKISSNVRMLDFTGKLTLNQSARIILKSELVISHDTGLMHIAAAFKKKIVSIWGNTVPEFGMYPYLPDDGSKIFEVKGLSCRPCSKIGYKKCPKEHFNCMLKQDENAIAEYVNSLT